MKKIFLFFLLICVTGGQLLSDDGKYMELVGKADKAISREEWDSASEYLIEAMRSEPGNPTNVMLLSNLGMVKFYCGNDSLALSMLDDAHRLAPSSVTVLANRARILTSIGREKEAIRDYDMIESLDSLYASPYLYRGLIYLHSGMINESKKNLDKLSQLAPDSEDTWIALASYYTTVSEPDNAMPYYNKLIKKSAEPEYYAGRAMCLLMKDMLADAADDIASGIELDDEYSELYVCRALLNKKRYRMDDAIADATIAIRYGADKKRLRDLLNL